MNSLESLAIVCASILGLASVWARADTTYLASSFETLYRVTEGGGTESFDFDVKLRGMHHDASTGDTLVLGDAGGSAPATVYMLGNAVSGTPTLTQYCNLSRDYGSLTQIGSTFYAFSADELYILDLSDPSNPVETYIGSTGVGANGGAAYDPDSETLYMVSYSDIDSLYTVDPNTGGATPIGSGLGVDSGGYGAEWFGGQVFAAAQNHTSGDFEIGTVDVVSGLYSATITVSAGGAADVATSLTVIPEPATLGLLLVACVALSRRGR
jgi:hypothetical protein